MDTDLLQFECFRKLTDKTRKLVECICRSEPSRKVRSGTKNISGFYPSKKMGLTIQFESHTIELAAIYEKEHNPQVIAYYDQPPSFPINYEINGKRHGHLYTPDFFVIEENWIGWEEWKSEDELVKLSVSHPHRYCRNEDGTWACPPAEEYARQHELSFRVRTDKEINWIFQRNIHFLDDYLQQDSPHVSLKALNSLIKYIKYHPGISLDELLSTNLDWTADDVYKSIILNHIYVDLHREPIAHYNQVQVFPNLQTATAYMNLQTSQTTTRIKANTIQMKVGQKLEWDCRIWMIINVGNNELTLLEEQNKQVIQLPFDLVNSLLSEGKISGVSVHEDNSDVYDNLISASSKDLEDANYRYSVVQQKMLGEKHLPVPERTARHWVKLYKEAEYLYGNGYLGLLTQRKRKGNRNARYEESILELLEQYIQSHYETVTQRSKYTVYKMFLAECQRKSLTAPSARTFYSYINNRSIHETTKRRQGRKAAYTSEPTYHELTLKTPRHGDRPFEICHMDHTELDIELVCSKTGRNLGRPWVTFLVDAYSRRILALYLTFDSPSYRSCMMTFRECVKKHGRLPQKLVVDGGKEFDSIYFESLLASYKITKMKRPGSKPRFGSVCERLFGTTNQMFIHNLIGNTQASKEVRKMTKETNPKNNAIWSFSSFHDLIKEWAYEIYDTLDHPALGQSPKEAFISSVAKSGTRSFTVIPYDENFIMLTLPSTRKGTAKVEPGKGVKINHLYYWSNSLLDPEVEGKQVPVRYDPFNVGIAFAYVQNRWIALNSEYYTTFVNRTEKEIRQASEELRKRMRQHGKNQYLSASKLAQFLKAAENVEVLLHQQIRDNEMRNSLEILSGGKKSASNSSNHKGNLSVISTQPKKKKIDVHAMRELEEF